MTTPAQTIQSVESAGVDTPIILDFDETLFLRNSTEAYLDSIYPRPLGAAFLMAVKAVKPWRFFPTPFRQQEISKDWFLVVAATLLFPWTQLVWRQRAKKLAEAYYNQPLVQAVEANPQAQVVIATLGFGPIVKPLIKHLPETFGKNGQYKVIACRFWQGVRDRAKGKLAMVTDALGAESVSNAVVVTDSMTDAPLLEFVETPCLLTWPDAEYIPAMSDVYVPLFYSEKVKNPKVSHIIRRVLLGHWAFLVIALSFQSPHPVLNAASLLVLTFSYWCVYEIGYQENDLIGEQYESKPILSENYAKNQYRVDLTQTLAPWFVAMGLAVPGVLLLMASQQSEAIATTFESLSQLWPTALLDGGIWLTLLLAVRLTFWIYNRFNEEARIWIYPLLQIQTLFGFALLTSLNMVGGILLLSLVVCRWLHYSIYRCGGDRWRFPINLSCLALFLMTFGAVVASSTNPLSLLTWQAAVALGYCAFKSIKDWTAVQPRFGLLMQEAAAMSERTEVLLMPAEDGNVPTEEAVSETPLSQALPNTGVR